MVSGARLMTLLLSLGKGEISQDEFDLKLEQLMHLPILRDALVPWHKIMLEKLTEEKVPPKGSRPINLITYCTRRSLKLSFKLRRKHVAR